MQTPLLARDAPFPIGALTAGGRLSRSPPRDQAGADAAGRVLPASGRSVSTLVAALAVMKAETETWRREVGEISRIIRHFGPAIARALRDDGPALRAALLFAAGFPLGLWALAGLVMR